MKFASAIVAITSLLAGRLGGSAQGFVNFNFESGNFSGHPPGSMDVPIANALPNWSGYYGSLIFGTQQVSQVLYDNLSLGAAAISVHDTNGSLTPIEGNYSVILQGSSGSTPTSSAIGQSGQIPVSMQSLIFWGGFSGQITFDGQPISYTAIGSGPNYTIYGGDISAFAGQTGELLFRVLPNNSGILDSIQFSNQPIPEPSTLSLFALGSLLFGWRRWRNASR